jgi:hypothetical protein
MLYQDFPQHIPPILEGQILPFNYCKYRLLRYKPWTKTQSDVWGGQENPTDELLIDARKEYIQTPSAQEQVPDWLEKLQCIVQSQHDTDDQSCDDHGNTREEWMILSYLILIHHLTTWSKYQYQQMNGTMTQINILNNKLTKCQLG